MPNTGLVSLLRRTFWISFVTIGAIGLSVIGVAYAHRDRERWTQHSRDIVRLARKAQLYALDRETGVRGFLLTGDSATLEPDIASRAQLAATVDSLVRLTADNPTQQRRAAAFAAALARWDSLFATPAIEQRANLGTGSIAMSFGNGGFAGKLLFDDVRLRFAEFEREEEALYRARRANAARLLYVNVVITVVGLSLLALTLAALRRRVTLQARALVERQGQLEEQATQLEEQASEMEEQATELEAQTEELQETVRELGRKNEELNSFSSSVAHDLRSPLRSIDGYSHMLLTDYGDRLDDAGVGTLKRIRVNAQRMGELIDGLLSLARVSGGELRMAWVDLSEVATGTADDVRRNQPEGRAIDVTVQSGLSARGDARLLRVAMYNLLDNAMKFTRVCKDARVEVGAKLLDGQRTFYVTDNGIGFDMRYADKLFGAFERLHHDPAYEGTGVGLATVRRIVERHGGRLWAESEPGRGATFYFTFAE